MSDEGSRPRLEGGGTVSQSTLKPTASPGCGRVFYVLSEPRRRYALYHLAQTTDGIAELDELVAAVRRFEAADSGSDAQASASTVTADLRETHLPCLAEATYVDYDPRQGTVRYDPTSLLSEWVERIHENNRGEPL